MKPTPEWYSDFVRLASCSSGPEKLAMLEAADCIKELAENYRQVSKALCGKENATVDEILQSINQVRYRLERLEAENAALLYDMVHVVHHELCDACAHAKGEAPCEAVDFNCDRCPEECPCKNCHECRSNFVHRGPCPENTNGGNENV